MVDKIKQYGQYALDFVVAILLGVVYFLFQRNKSLESKNSELKADINVKAILDQVAAQKVKADDEEQTYRDVVKRYNSESGDGSGQTH